MISLTTNHKVGDTVYVLSDCVRRGEVMKVTFNQLTELTFDLSYEVLYDGYAFNTVVESEVEISGSPLYGSPLPLVVGSPEVTGSPETPNMVPLDILTVVEVAAGGGIYSLKADAVAAFADALA